MSMFVKIQPPSSFSKSMTTFYFASPNPGNLLDNAWLWMGNINGEHVQKMLAEEYLRENCGKVMMTSFYYPLGSYVTQTQRLFCVCVTNVSSRYSWCCDHNQLNAKDEHMKRGLLVM